MKYKLKSGRIVEKGDYVSVRLTDKTINFFKSMGLLEEVPQTRIDEYMDELVDVEQDYYNQHETPLSLIEEFYTVLITKKFPKDIDYWIQGCGQWFNDDTYIEKA